MKVAIAIVFSAFFCSFSNALSGKDLHELMNSDERNFYFGHHEDFPEDDQFQLISIETSETNSTRFDSTNLSFDAFGSSYSMLLTKNPHLIHPETRLMYRTEDGNSKPMELNLEDLDCHFLHQDEHTGKVAAFSLCSHLDDDEGQENNGMARGMVVDGDSMIEIHPLNKRIRGEVSKRSSDRHFFMARKRSSYEPEPHIGSNRDNNGHGPLWSKRSGVDLSGSNRDSNSNTDPIMTYGKRTDPSVDPKFTNRHGKRSGFAPMSEDNDDKNEHDPIWSKRSGVDLSGSNRDSNSNNDPIMTYGKRVDPTVDPNFSNRHGKRSGFAPMSEDNDDKNEHDPIWSKRSGVDLSGSNHDSTSNNDPILTYGKRVDPTVDPNFSNRHGKRSEFAPMSEDNDDKNGHDPIWSKRSGVDLSGSNHDSNSNNDPIMTYGKRADPTVDPHFTNRHGKRSYGSQKYIELGVFIDESDTKLYKKYYGGSDAKRMAFYLCYLNGVQALYLIPSLGEKVYLSISRLEELQRNPSELSFRFTADRQALFNSFAKWQSEQNPGDDTNPGHWDIGVFVTGLDLTSGSSTVTMGLAATGAACSNKWNAVITELGVKERYSEKSYPSTGFTACFVLAHEIGHNLGMPHDSGKSKSDPCYRGKYIMAPSRGLKGKTTWSSCSARTLRTLSESLKCLNDKPGTPARELPYEAPGEECNLDCQCRAQSLDNNAYHETDPATESEVCYSFWCKSPSQPNFKAGPALPGTRCGNAKWCVEGMCVRNTADYASNRPSSSSKPRPPSPAAGSGSGPSWSDWVSGPCESKCIVGAKGYRTMTRECRLGGRLADGCPIGPKIKYDFCDDSAVCSGARRKTPDEYASDQCAIYASYNPSILIIGGFKAQGTQVAFSDDDPTLSCSVFCKRYEDAPSRWYSPQPEFMRNSKVSSYFPDGTHCGSKGGSDYYCQLNTCLPENARIAKSLGDKDGSNYQNLLGGADIPNEVKNCFSLDDSKTRLPGCTKKLSQDHFEEIEDNNDIVNV